MVTPLTPLSPSGAIPALALRVSASAATAPRRRLRRSPSQPSPFLGIRPARLTARFRTPEGQAGRSDQQIRFDEIATMMRSLLLDAKHSYSAKNRRRKADFAIEFGRRHDVASVLLVGVDRDIFAATRATPTTNQVERAIEAAFPRVVATGLAERATGWTEYVCADALRLPFCDGEFDLVYSNAVIEHVGQFEKQRAFVREHVRVGRHWVFTTPNRLFPVESHTLTIARHMNPRWRPPRPAYTRLLSRRDLVELIPPTARIHGRTFSPTFTVSSD
jgi:hypothetical protein